MAEKKVAEKIIERVKFDRTDQRILELIQDDATLSLAVIAERVGRSQNACWRRIKQLEAIGVIEKRVTLLRPEAVGLGLTVFVSVRTSEHNPAWLTRFAAGAAQIPEVVEFHRLSGETDYLLKVVVSDIKDYDRIYKKLIAAAPLTDVSSAFSMERIKYTTQMPISVG